MAVVVHASGRKEAGLPDKLVNVVRRKETLASCPLLEQGEAHRKHSDGVQDECIRLLRHFKFLFGYACSVLFSSLLLPHGNRASALRARARRLDGHRVQQRYFSLS